MAARGKHPGKRSGNRGGWSRPAPSWKVAADILPSSAARKSGAKPAAAKAAETVVAPSMCEPDAKTAAATPLAPASKSLRDSADVGRNRERARRRRLLILAASGAGVVVWAALRDALGLGFFIRLPMIDPMYWIVGAFFLMMIASLLATTLIGGRSPHVTYRPEQIDVRIDDVKGLGPVREEVTRSLDLFLGGKTFRATMGGTPRRGLLFEGSPGTGKTYMAKALAAEAGVPFLFVSATSFQSMYYGATARKIRSYFKALRKAARAEGGAIGFIEEIDAIAMARGGMNSMSPAAASNPATGLGAGVMCCGGLEGLPGAPGGFQASASAPAGGGVQHPGARLTSQIYRSVVSEGTGGVVNELLVQMQSFDEPTGLQQLRGKITDAINLLLPASHQIPRPRVEPLDLLLIAATNRADNLDPALLRPGRFDRRLTFDLPDHRGRREIIDHFLGRKNHDEAMATDERRDALAGVTQGYSPVMIENLLDEALINAMRRGSTRMSWSDVERARLVTEVGLGQPVSYTEHEKRVIATHEAGHATVAYLEAPNRRLEILSIIKRASALGLLAHGDREDVYTRSSAELTAMIRIALGGQTAERQFFGDVTTGPASDLQYATTIAAQMIGAAGMGETLVSFAAVDGSLTQNLVGRVISDSDGRAMLTGLLDTQRDYVQALLKENADLVEALRDALLDRHELIGHEITDVLEAAKSRRSTSPDAATDTTKENTVIDLTALERGLDTITVESHDAGVDQVEVRTDGQASDLPKRSR